MEKQGAATFGKGYEVNCCAVAACCDLPHRSGTEKHRQARRRKSEAEHGEAEQGMARHREAKAR
nr:MAG TPA: hypothetical protein [Caudoviricetes sp.]